MKQLFKNKDFRSISPNEYIEAGTLVWIEKNTHTNETIVEGPYVIEEGWGPIYFGEKNKRTPRGSYVKLVSTITGEVDHVSQGCFLFSTYYVMNEERLCTDVETKQK